MIACYDLARCPPTYDVVSFLALLEQERLRRGSRMIDLHILPGPNNGFRKDSLWPPTVGQRVSLRENVLVQICSLLPSVRSVAVRSDRQIEGWGKGEYLISLPAIVKALKAGGPESRPLRMVPAVKFRHPTLLTFTLREAEHHPLRNSQTSEWFAAAKELSKRYEVIVLRDTHKADEPSPDGIKDDPDASRYLRSRAYWYSWATLNVGICNGPMWLAIFMNAPTLMLRPTTNAAQGCYDDQFYRRWGLPPGSQLPSSPPHQRLVWQDDTCANIVRAIEEMLESDNRA